MAAAIGTSTPLPKAMPMAPKLAYRNLFHDQDELVRTLVGIVFSVVLIAVMCSIYIGSEPHCRCDGSYQGRSVGGPRRPKSFDLPPTPVWSREVCRSVDSGVQSAENIVVSFVNWRRLRQGTDKMDCSSEKGSAGPCRAVGRLRHRSQ